VADGTVVNVYDGADEQIPGPDATPTGITTENIGGNMIVVDIGGGNFAFYAHLQKGSLKVALGDVVTAGQALALLGNTGNTTAPHLHFHVMDSTSPLDAQGLPYVFRRFTSRGVVASDAAIEDGAPATIDAGRAGEKAEAMPLNNEVVSFD
jgi:murein DD-endopeptidase MepM/ murein hydrolase activator NlpD